MQKMQDEDDSEEGEGEDQVGDLPKPKVWDETKEPLKEGEELEYDGSAYIMLHRTKVEWPCLSIDYLVRERCTLDGFTPAATWFPAQANGALDPNSANTY
jgi:hypothetical protein